VTRKRTVCFRPYMARSLPSIQGCDDRSLVPHASSRAQDGWTWSFRELCAAIPARGRSAGGSVKTWLLLAAVVALDRSTPATAQPESNQSALNLPNLAVPSSQLADARKYIVFHKMGVTVEEAQADLSFCWRFLPHGSPRWVPGFVPWQQSNTGK